MPIYASDDDLAAALQAYHDHGQSYSKPPSRSTSRARPSRTASNRHGARNSRWQTLSKRPPRSGVGR